MTAAGSAKPPLPWSALFVSTLVGTCFLMVNFPHCLLRTIDLYISTPAWQQTLSLPVIYTPNVISSAMHSAPSFFFSQIMSYNFFSLWVLLAAVALFSLRHVDARLLILFATGIFFGYSGLHIISWIVIIGIELSTIVFHVINWLFQTVRAILRLTFEHGWRIILLGIAALVIYLARKDITRILLFLFGAAAIEYVLYVVSPIIWKWLVDLFSPLLRFLDMLLKWLIELFYPIYRLLSVFWEQYVYPVLLAVFALVTWTLLACACMLAGTLVLATMGRLVIDQIKAGWRAGEGRKGLALSGFAIGSGIALVTLMSVAAPPVSTGIDEGWRESFRLIGELTNIAYFFNMYFSPTEMFVATMPVDVKEFVFTYMINAKAPIIDGVVLYVVIWVSLLSVTLRFVPKMPENPKNAAMLFLPKEYFSILGGTFYFCIYRLLASYRGG